MFVTMHNQSRGPIEEHGGGSELIDIISEATAAAGRTQVEGL